MLPLQWVASGLVLVVLDLYVGAGWDVLADPVGWVLALGACLVLRDRLGPYPALLAAVSLAVSVVAWVPGVLSIADPSLAWGLSLPQAAFAVVLALRLAELLPDHARTLRACAWTNAAVALLPIVVLGGGLTSLVGLLSFAAVAAVLWLAFLLLGASPQLPREPAVRR